MGRQRRGVLAMACLAGAAGCAPQSNVPPWRDALEKGQVIRLAPAADKPAVLAASAPGHAANDDPLGPPPPRPVAKNARRTGR